MTSQPTTSASGTVPFEESMRAHLIPHERVRVTLRESEDLTLHAEPIEDLRMVATLPSGQKVRIPLDASHRSAIEESMRAFVPSGIDTYQLSLKHLVLDYQDKEGKKQRKLLYHNDEKMQPFLTAIKAAGFDRHLSSRHYITGLQGSFLQKEPLPLQDLPSSTRQILQRDWSEVRGFLEEAEEHALLTRSHQMYDILTSVVGSTIEKIEKDLQQAESASSADQTRHLQALLSRLNHFKQTYLLAADSTDFHPALVSLAILSRLDDPKSPEERREKEEKIQGALDQKRSVAQTADHTLRQIQPFFASLKLSKEQEQKLVHRIAVMAIPREERALFEQEAQLPYFERLERVLLSLAVAKDDELAQEVDSLGSFLQVAADLPSSVIFDIKADLLSALKNMQTVSPEDLSLVPRPREESDLTSVDGDPDRFSDTEAITLPELPERSFL